MRAAGSRPDRFTLPLVIRAAASLPGQSSGLGEAVQCLGFRSGFATEVYFCNAVIEFYSRRGRPCSAHRLFDEMRDRDVVSWTSLISGYVGIGDVDQSFFLFSAMRSAGFEPTSVTLAVVLRACGVRRDMKGGVQLYAFVIKSGLGSHELVNNSILTVFSKAGRFEEMEKFFAGIERRDVVPWNIMMSGYSYKDDAFKVIDCFEKMKAEVIPGHETLTLVVSAFAKCGDLVQGEKVHGYAIKSGQIDAILQSTYIDFYARCGELVSSIQLFEEARAKKITVWSVMMWGFIQNGEFLKAIDLFQSMQTEGFEPCSDTLKGLVISYTHLGALQWGKSVHGYLMRSKLGMDRHDKLLETSVLNMYLKCGSIVIAKRFFDHMLVKDVVALSSMIDGYAVHGHGLEALNLFKQMQEKGMEPNSITFVSLLTACSHSGLVDEGCEVFDCMTRKYGIKPDLNHYTCMVDLFGRSGKLERALEIINNMDVEPDGRVWGSLLASCRLHSDSKLAAYAAQRLFSLEPDNVGYHVVLSNIHASDDKWEDAEDIRNFVAKRVKKKPGWSCIEVNCGLHTFVAGDVSHPQVGKIYRLLRFFSRQFEESH